MLILLSLSILLHNPNRSALTDAPVCLQVPADVSCQSATVVVDGQEVPCQVDDLDGDGRMDELSFVVNMPRRASRRAEITWHTTLAPANRYAPRVHAQMWFKDNDKSRSYTQKQHIPTDTVSEVVDNMYSKMMHHGPAFENEKVAYRVYFDKKQSTDLYGKRIPQLELADGLWYSSEVPELVNDRTFGDDIILVGQTISIGTLRGWDDSRDDPSFATSAPGTKIPDPCMVMIDPFEWRQAHIVAKGPVRTVVDMNVRAWKYKGQSLDVKSRYILYAGNRECQVIQYITHSPLPTRPPSLLAWSKAEQQPLDNSHSTLDKLEFVTGVMKVGVFNTDSTQLAGLHYMADGKGLCASYGKDWPDGNHKLYPQMSAAALAVSIDQSYVTRVIDRKEQILYGVHPDADGVITYRMAFCAPDKEGALLTPKPWTPRRWFSWCRKWHKLKPVEVKATK